MYFFVCILRSIVYRTEENETKSTTSSKKSQVSPISDETTRPISDSTPTTSSTLRLRSPAKSEFTEEQLDTAVEVDTSDTKP